jgi:hypothetical protein
MDTTATADIEILTTVWGTECLKGRSSSRDAGTISAADLRRLYRLGLVDTYRDNGRTRVQLTITGRHLLADHVRATRQG